MNLSAVQTLNNGDWGVASKLMALAGGGSTPTPAAAAPVAQVASTPTPQPAAVVAPTPAAAVVISAPAAAAPSSSGPVATAGKLPRAGGKPGGNGTSTFLYMALDKAKKRAAEVAKELSTRVGGNITMDVDLNTLAKDSSFTKESEVDQKALLTGPVQASWSGALFAANNGVSTVEAAIRAGTAVQKIKWVYAPSVSATPGWGFLEVTVAAGEVTIKCPVSSADETYGASAGVSVAPQAAAPAAIAAPVVAVPLAAAVPVIAPVAVAPVAHVAPAVSYAAPVAVAAPQVATPPPAAAPAGPIPGGRYTHVGGKSGGNGTTGFLYTPFEKLKKFVADNCTKEFAKALGVNRVSVVLDPLFAKNPAFTQLSEADQRGLLAGPITHNIPQILYAAPNGDHLAALFRNEKYMERCLRITKITIVYAPDVASSEGFTGAEINWVEGGTELQFRIDLASADCYFLDSSWSILKKAHEGIFGIEKRAAEAARILEERRAMEALESVARANMAAADLKAAEEKAAAAKIAEQERLRKELEATAAERVKTLEDAGVTPHVREHNERLQKAIAKYGDVSGSVEYDVDNLFIHDRKLRWRDCGTQKTTLKSISIEPWSLFSVLTDASIAILESGKVGREKFLSQFKKMVLQFEASTATAPKLLRDESGTLLIFGTFSNLYDPRKWLDIYLTGLQPRHIWNGTTITEYYKAFLADAGGFLEDMARDEATTMFNDLLAPFWKKDFEGRVVPIEVDWKSLDSFNMKEGLMARLKKHYQFPSCILLEVFKCFADSNDVVMKVLRKMLQKIRVVATASDSIILENKGETMIIAYNWDKQQCPTKNWKVMLEDQVRAKCEGLTVKNVSAEIAMATAAPTLLELNRLLVTKMGMLSAGGGYDVLVVDYPKFVDTIEFGKAHQMTKFKCLHDGNLGALRSLVRGFEDVSRTPLGGPLLKTVKRIHVTLDVNSKDNSDDAPLHWDDATKTFTVTHCFSSFEHPQGYNYTPRIEYTMGILIESCRLDTRSQVDGFYAQVRKDYQLNSLPVIIDESYQQTKEFTSIHPSKMKAIVMRMFTSLPPSIFCGEMGLAHCAEFPKARQILHTKVKKIRLLPDGKLASKTHETTLSSDELLVRVAFDCPDWSDPIGYHLTGLIGSRPTMEAEVIAEIDAAFEGITTHLRQHANNNKISVKFDWPELQADSTFKASAHFVNEYVRHVLKKVKLAFDGTSEGSAVYDFGITHYLKTLGLAPALAGVENLVFHMSTKNAVSTQGKFGLFTPYQYDVSQTGKDVHIRFNYRKYKAGCGSMLEWVLTPAKGLDRQKEHIVRISERNYKEEVERREREVARTHAQNEDNQDEYERDMARYNRDQQEFVNTPMFERCSSCSGKGHWGGKHMNRCSPCNGSGQRQTKRTAPTMPTVPRIIPIPTFPHITVADFTTGLNREELRLGHGDD